MAKRILTLLVFSLALFITPSWATTCVAAVEQITCTNTLSSTDTTATFDFSASGDGVIVFQFETVLRPFELDVTANDIATITNLDTTEFPTGTVCITYSNGHCVHYDVTGAGGGAVPVRGVDFKGLITLTLNYNSSQPIHIPAFGHAPGDVPGANFSEDILTSYVDPNAPCPSCIDPAMGGRTPGISSFAALDKPFAPSVQPGNVCSLTAVPQNSTNGQNPLIEVSFKLVASNCSTDPPIRDKTATLSVASFDSNGHLVFASLVNNGDSNKFHFDNTAGLNVQDINTNGLKPNFYYVTVISSKFSPVRTSFTVPTNP
jgi:hypothetical protein